MFHMRGSSSTAPTSSNRQSAQQSAISNYSTSQRVDEEEQQQHQDDSSSSRSSPARMSQLKAEKLQKALSMKNPGIETIPEASDPVESVAEGVMDVVDDQDYDDDEYDDVDQF